MANLAMRLIGFVVCYTLCLYYNIQMCIGVLIAFLIKRDTKMFQVKERSRPEFLKSNEYGEHKYAKVNNVKLHYVEKGDSKKPLIVFVHGFPEFWYSWRYQIKEFSKDYWTVAVDMRGYADSEKPSKISDYDIDYMVDDIKELVKYLGREKFILVAHDWGAVIAWRFVTKYMSMVEKYVMIGGPPSPVWKKLLMSSWEQFRMSWYVFYFQMPCIPEFIFSLSDYKMFELMKTKTSTNDDIEAYKYTFSQKNGIRGPLNYYRANSKFLSEPPPLKRPTTFAKGLYMLGEKELYISKKSGDMAKRFFENLDFKIIKDANHFAQQDNPEETNRLIRQFLSD